MKTCWLFVYLITVTAGFTQVDPSPPVLPEARIVRVTLDSQIVTVLHLRPGYISTVSAPEDVSSVVLGNPGMFKAEHSTGSHFRIDDLFPGIRDYSLTLSRSDAGLPI
jgi:hypothetical protein